MTDNPRVRESFRNIDRIDLDNLENNYRPGELIGNLGLTRDTLRYYEEIGLIKPKQNNWNHYREYDIYDIQVLMAIDFYKKRGLPLQEIQEIIAKSDLASLQVIFHRTQKEIEESIKKQQLILEKLKETALFTKDLEESLNKFCMIDMPLYKVVGEFSAISAFEEYRDKVLTHVSLSEEDLLTKMMRRITFDSNGYKETMMYLVEKSLDNTKTKDSIYLEYGKCLYTVVESGRYSDDDNHLMGEMYKKVNRWAEEHGVLFKGEVYLHVNLMAFHNNKERTFVEVWAPLQD